MTRIRAAHAGDAQALHEVYIACCDEAYSAVLPAPALEWIRSHSLERWQEALVDPRGVWIAHDDGEPVGFAHAIAAGAGQARPLELDKLYVRERAYGTGLAARLLETAIGDAPCLTWVANYNERAQRFYAKNGFAFDDSEGSVWQDLDWPEIQLLRMVR